jgi:hypothetical protein
MYLWLIEHSKWPFNNKKLNNYDKYVDEDDGMMELSYAAGGWLATVSCELASVKYVDRVCSMWILVLCTNKI